MRSVSIIVFGCKQFLGPTLVSEARFLLDSCGGGVLQEFGICLTGVSILSGIALEGLPVIYKNKIFLKKESLMAGNGGHDFSFFYW